MKLLSRFIATLLSFNLILGYTTASASTNERPELGNFVYTYSSCNAEPVEVHVLRVGNKDKKEFLVQILGVDHALNGKAKIYTVEDLNTSKLKFRFVNRNGKTLESALSFDGGDDSARLYIRRYTGLYTPTGKLPENIDSQLCLRGTQLDRLQFYRRYEKQQTNK